MLADGINWGGREKRIIRAPANRIVPTTSNNPLPLIIHVRNPQVKQGRLGSANVAEWLAESGLDVRLCDDVYLGLAMILRTRDPRLRAVVACVDDIRTEEFEFFTLVARFRVDLPVYVYGRDHASPRVTRAIELGATGEATEAAIEALKPPTHDNDIPDTANQSVERERPDQGLSIVPDAVGRDRLSIESIRDSERRDPCAKGATEQQPQDGKELEGERSVKEETAPTRNESGTVGHEEPDDAVRLPWLRYANRPVRQGPKDRVAQHDVPSPQPSPLEGEGAAPGINPDATGRMAPGINRDTTRRTAPGINPDATPQPQPQAASSVSDTKPDYEPLLTEAELEALMNDDFDDFDSDEVHPNGLGLHEREMLTGDGAEGEGGRR